MRAACHNEYRHYKDIKKVADCLPWKAIRHFLRDQLSHQQRCITKAANPVPLIALRISKRSDKRAQYP